LDHVFENERFGNQKEVSSGKFLTSSPTKGFEMYQQKTIHTDLKKNLRYLEKNEKNIHVPFLKYFINLEKDQSKVFSSDFF
jgi:hypothetical protein